MTIGRFVMVRKGHQDDSYLLTHELVHVRQYREQTVPGFLLRYFSRYLLLRLDGWNHDAAYRRLPEEVEADWEARRTLGWGVPPHDRDEPVDTVGSRGWRISQGSGPGSGGR